ncbi:hypothetical protein SCHPADRAFT_264249 [Schizopora paradoxa]|uniref:Uncharacterized protein n=1 Tax=Schizopora paradoxa TaxID=27342 RepID=A0A0H2S0S1_9AGAM|nr:hypothetical protein SCHPADRAFT_264249 [Schizopora paradoxa]
MTDLMTGNHGNDANTRIAFHKKTPSEIWDDDFDFQSGSTSNDLRSVANDGRDHDLPPSLRQKLQKTTYNQAKDSVMNMRMDSGPSRQANGHDHDPLRAWAESSSARPSPSHRHTPSKSGGRGKTREEDENWDDDFVDKTDSPVRPSHSARALHSPTKSNAPREENWDEDFEMGENDDAHGRSDFPSAIETLRASIDASPSSKRSRTDASWDSSSEDEDHGGGIMGDDAEFGVFGRARRADEEDRTVTARSRRRLMDLNTDSSVPPVPPIPSIPRQGSSSHISSSHNAHHTLPTIPSGDVPPSLSLQHMAPSLPPFPRSPTLSVFSIPATTGSSSAHGSTTLLTGNLHRTLSGSSGAGQPRNAASKRFPAASPTRPPKERRRLRKKSRPPHLDGNIIELDDRTEYAIASEYLQRRPMTPEGRTGRRSRSHSRSSMRTPSLPRDSFDSIGSPMSVDGDPVPSLPMKLDTLPRPPGPSSAPPLPSQAMPTSPPRAGAGTSRSPLLTRIGSMKRWSAGMGLSNIGGSRRKRSSTGPDVVVADAERDRQDNNRTPRPASSSVSRATSPPPPLPPAEIEMRARPISGFFRSSEGVDSTPRKKEMKREKSKDAPLRIVTANVESMDHLQNGLAAQASPRRIRLRALGLGPRVPSGSSNTSESTDSHSVKQDGLGDGDVHMTSPPTSSPKVRSGLRPRLPSYRAPSSTPHKGPIKPRHVSGSAIVDTRQRESGENPPTSHASLLAPGAEDTADSHADTEKKEGHRSFMGGMRRISLVGGQKRSKHRREKSSGSITGTEDIVMGDAPPVPSLPSTSPRDNLIAPQTSGLLPPVELVSVPPRRSSLQRVDVDVPSPSIDITSPISTSLNQPLRDTSNISESSSAPALVHSRSSNFITTISSNSVSGGPPSPTRKGKSAIMPIKTLNGSPQAASLGRASQIMTPSKAAASGLGSAAMNMNAAMRRNSLGDLKIPSRISRAQDGLKRDLTRVREFAAHIEQMKEQRSQYYTLVNELQSVLETPPRPPSRALSPSFFNMSRPVSRARSNTNPPPPPASDDYRNLAVTFRSIDSRYRVAWECADLLIELGSGAGVATSPVSPPLSIAVSSTSPGEGTSGSVRGGKKGRERAVTLAGDESKPSTPINGSPNGASAKDLNPPALLSWRASTGRHDLNQRQLLLLKEMLHNADSAKEGITTLNPNADVFSSERSMSVVPPVPTWLQKDGMESTATLPTEESSSAACPSPQKKRPNSRLALLGLRDMLRSLKRNHGVKSGQANGSLTGHSTTTLSTEASSHDVHTQSTVSPTNPSTFHPYPSQQKQETVPPSRSPGRRRSKTSVQPDSMRIPSQGSGVSDNPRKPYLSGISLTQGHNQHKSSPRRPSLASLFRLGQKHKAGSSGTGSEQALEKSSPGASDKQLSKGNSQTATENEDDDSDWDRMDSASDVDVPVDPAASPATKGDVKGTLRSRLSRTPSRPQAAMSPANSRPVTPGISALNNASQMSLTSSSAEQSTAQLRLPRLSNVDEDRASEAPSGRVTPASPTSNKRRPTSRGGKDRDAATLLSSTVRTFPAGVKTTATVSNNSLIPVFDIAPMPLVPDMPMKLSMTPDNIKPLLENAKIVTTRLGECIREVKELLASRTESLGS